MSFDVKKSSSLAQLEFLAKETARLRLKIDRLVDELRQLGDPNVEPGDVFEGGFTGDPLVRAERLIKKMKLRVQQLEYQLYAQKMDRTTSASEASRIVRKVLKKTHTPFGWKMAYVAIASFFQAMARIGLHLWTQQGDELSESGYDSDNETYDDVEVYTIEVANEIVDALAIKNAPLDGPEYTLMLDGMLNAIKNVKEPAHYCDVLNLVRTMTARALLGPERTGTMIDWSISQARVLEETTDSKFGRGERVYLRQFIDSREIKATATPTQIKMCNDFMLTANPRTVRRGVRDGW